MMYQLTKLMSFLLLFGVHSVLAQSPFKNTLYIIRNAEAAIGGSLSDAGLTRASNCIPSIFGPGSTSTNVGLIMSCTPDRTTGICEAAVQTIEPLAISLGLDIDVSCAVFTSDGSNNCIKARIADFVAESDKDIVLVWDDKHMGDLGVDFGLRGISEDQVNVVYVLRNNIFVSQTTQECAPHEPLSSGDPIPIPAFPGSPLIPAPVPQPASSADVVPGPSLPTAPVMGPANPSSPSDGGIMANLYYYTTFFVPDPVQTPSIEAVPVAPGVNRRRATRVRRSCRTGRGLLPT